MEEMMVFFTSYGWQITLIAFIGIVLLGILKYANVFKKIEKEKRKPIYLAISVGFSLIATIIYLLIIGSFSVEYVITVTTATYGLNQAMYSIYEQTTLRDLVIKLMDIIKARLKKSE